MWKTNADSQDHEQKQWEETVKIKILDTILPRFDDNIYCLKCKKKKGGGGYLRGPYKWLWKEEKWKAKEKRKDIPIWMKSSKE